MQVLLGIDGCINLLTVFDDQSANGIWEILDLLVTDSMRGQYLEQINRGHPNLALGKDLPGHLPHELVSDL
jgi:hypothetical protein